MGKCTQKESDFGQDDGRSLQSENMLSPEDNNAMPSNTPMPSNKGEELEENSDNGNTTDSKSENEGSTPSSASHVSPTAWTAARVNLLWLRVQGRQQLPG